MCIISWSLFINVNLEKMPINKGVKNIIAQINLIYVVNSCFYIYIENLN